MVDEPQKFELIKRPPGWLADHQANWDNHYFFADFREKVSQSHHLGGGIGQLRPMMKPI
jgi:hypothetical protein